jgi:2-iminobutanoate/2-iminopropanoate deaminase
VFIQVIRVPLSEENTLEKQIIHTDQAPAAVGPYSQAVQAGNFIYTAGQIGLDPATGKLVAGDVAAQAEQVVRNLTAVLAAGGSSLAQVVKTTVFLTDMADFQAMNEVYGRYFPSPYPARSTVAVAGLPLGARVEIEVVAML